MHDRRLRPRQSEDLHAGRPAAARRWTPLPAANRIGTSGAAGWLAAQRTFGNRAVTGLIEAQRAGAGRTAGPPWPLQRMLRSSLERDQDLLRTAAGRRRGEAHDEAAPAAGTPQQECADAILAGAWETLVELLAEGSAEAPWQTAVLGSLDPDQLRHLDDAARRSGRERHRLRTAIEDAQIALGATGDEVEPGAGYGTVTVIPSAGIDGDNTTRPPKPYSYSISIEFEPNAAARADEIAFVQSVRVVDIYNGENVWHDPRSARRMTEDRTWIDRVPGHEQGWYGMLDDGPGHAVTPWTRGGNSRYAEMYDEPRGAWNCADWSFETSVVSRRGPDAGTVYAVVTWGFTVDVDLRITVKPHQVFNKPTRSFHAAVDAWNAQAAGPVEGRNARGQQPLPALH